MRVHASSSDYEEHRKIIYQTQPQLRDQMELLDFTLHRLQQLKGEPFHDAFERLRDQQCLRSVGGDQYELVNNYGTDQVGLLLWLIGETQKIVPLRYTDVSVRSLIETVCDRRQPQPQRHDCQKETPTKQDQPAKEISVTKPIHLHAVAARAPRDHANTPRGSGSERRVSMTAIASGRSSPDETLRWARFKAKADAADYIAKAIKVSGIKKQDLAKALGLHPTRISQLLSTKGDLAYEPVPSALLYEIAHITECPYIARCSQLQPPPSQPKEERNTKQ